jgi:hypothetical protein
MDGTEFRVGDRVLVKPDEGWLQPTRRLAGEGRPATVVNVSVATFTRGAIKVEFDVKRKGAKPHTLFAYPQELTALRAAPPTP